MTTWIRICIETIADPQHRYKLCLTKKEKGEESCVGYSPLRTGGFSCILNVLHGDPEINTGILNVFDQKIGCFFTVNFIISGYKKRESGSASA